MALVGAQFVNAVSPNPVGSLQAYAGASAPTGWLMCDGSSYSTSVYPELFSVLGYTYGGSSGNFNVPDLRGRMPIGAGNDGTAANNATRTRGGKGGDTRMPQHNHGVTDPGHGHLGDYFTPNALGGGGGAPAQAFSGTAYNVARANTTGISVNNAGSGSGENMPPFLVTNYIIKAVPDAPRSGLAYGSTPPIVTALPANPQFGDVVTYIADATNGVAWNLQYDASGTYPWKFVGGAPLASGPHGGTTWAGSVGTTSGTLSDLTGGSLAITLPLAGDYTVGGTNMSRHGGGDVGCSTFVGTASAGAWAAGDVFTYTQTTIHGMGVSVVKRLNTVSASSVLRMYNASSNASFTATFYNMRLHAQPIRVKAA